MAYTPFPAVPRGDADSGGGGGESTVTKVWNGSAFVTVPGATIYVGPSAESAVADSDGDQYLATD